MKKVNVSNQTRRELKVLRNMLGFGTYSQTISFLIKHYKDNRNKQEKELNQQIKKIFGL